MATEADSGEARASGKKRKLIARALYNFVGESEHEISFLSGEAILFVRRVDENWLEGELNGSIGIFPDNRVRLELDSHSLPSGSAVDTRSSSCGVALRDFPGDCPGDLPLKEGEIVQILSSVGEGWSRGRTEEDRVGIFPTRFVEPVHINDTKPRPKPRTTKPVPKPRTKINNETNHKTTNNCNENKGIQLTDTLRSSISNDALSFESYIDELQTSLDAEEKMLLSAQNLLKICSDNEKKEKLQQTIATRQENVEKLLEKLQFAETHKTQVLLDEPPKPVPDTPSSPSDPTSRQSPTDSTTTNCDKAKQELILTEKSYHQELHTFCTKVLPTFKKWAEIEWEELFSNIEDVTELSGRLCTAFDDPTVGLGSVYCRFATDIKDTYGIYCRNHESATQLLEKFYEGSGNADKIKKIMDNGKPELKSWDLHTLLIKPVQRVLKYSLLLDKVLKYTSKCDPDYNELYKSVKLSSAVSQDINELKRRKDILERYTGAGRDERRINLGTMRKKVRRLTQALTQRTGLRSATQDPKYATEEAKVLSLENALRSLQQDILFWIDQGDKLFVARDSLLETMSDYAVKSSVLNSKGVLLVKMKEKWKEHCKCLHESVISPLNILIGFFHDPLLLMDKRRVKLLDYDSLQHNLEKCTEPDKLQQLKESVTLAKRTYEALNTQLLEDLPKFTEKVTIGLTNILIVYLRQEVSFHEKMSQTLAQTPSSELTNSSIVKAHLDTLQSVFQDINKLSILPTSLAVSFGIILNSSSSSPHSLTHTPKSNVDINHFKPFGTLPQKRSLSLQNLTLSESSSLQNATPSKSSNTLAKRHSPIYEEIPDIPSKLTAATRSLNVSLDHLLSPPQYNEIADNDVGVDDDTPTNSDHEYYIPDDALLVPSPDLLRSPPSLTPSPFPCESPEEERKTNEDVPVGTELIVLYDFKAESSLELSLREGDVVELVCPYDESGSNDWWLVKCNNEEGYVPFNYLQIHTC